jgi:WD40 repeat protein
MEVQHVYFSPDGRLLAVDTVGGGLVKWTAATQLWDLSNGEASWAASVEEQPVFTRDGERFVVPIDGGGDLYSIQPVTKVATLLVSGDQARHALKSGQVPPEIKCSPDGRLIAVAGLSHVAQRPPVVGWFMERVLAAPTQMGGIVRIWDAGTCRLHTTFSDCRTIEFSPDGGAAALLKHYGTIELWDLPVTTLSNSWWAVVAYATLAWLASIATLVAPTKRLSRRTSKAEAGPAEPAPRAI